MLTFSYNKFKSIYYKTSIADNPQRSKNLVVILGLFFCISGAFGQNTTIVFNAKTNTTIGISKEIDNTDTRLIDKINTDATGSCIYNWNVNDFQFLTCSFHDGWSIYFPIIQGNHLTIKYKGEGQFEFEGTNKAEVDYYRNSRIDITQSFMESSFNFPAESGFENYSLLIEKHYSQLSNALDSLEIENMVSQKFSDIVKNSFHILTICLVTDAYQTKYLENTATKVNGQDSTKVENKINELLDKISPMIDSGDILKYPLSNVAVGIYYTNKYRHLNEKDKEELLSKNTWANYLKPSKIGYLMTPEAMQYKLLSLELLDNCENAVTKGNSTLFDYISNIRPQNTFLPYLKEKQDELLMSINTDHSGVKYIGNTINALGDLSKVDVFDQKILYIDLWATWCGPCISEFKYKDKIHELLLDYKDIIPVYISIDEDNNDTIWKEKTKVFGLNGYHLRANEKLVTYINEKLYKGEGIGVPRYILLGKDGNILEDNLPRPGNIDKLKQELDKHFK